MGLDYNSTGLCNHLFKPCPLQKKCLTKGVVYKAEIKTKEDRETKEYIGMTANDFKVRYQNHIKSFKHKRYEFDTELSKYVWKLKNAGKDYGIKWSIYLETSSIVFGRWKALQFVHCRKI